MKSCGDCKHFLTKEGYKYIACVKRHADGKAGLNFGLLFFDLGNECPDFEKAREEGIK